MPMIRGTQDVSIYVSESDAKEFIISFLSKEFKFPLMGNIKEDTLYSIEDHGGSHSYYQHVPVRQATPLDHALDLVFKELKKKR